MPHVHNVSVLLTKCLEFEVKKVVGSRCEILRIIWFNSVPKLLHVEDVHVYLCKEGEMAGEERWREKGDGGRGEMAGEGRWEMEERGEERWQERGEGR